MRLDWSARALHDLECAADWSLGQAEAVVNAMEWMAETGFSLGRSIPGAEDRYWPVPPLGVIGGEVSTDTPDSGRQTVRSRRTRRVQRSGLERLYSLGPLPPVQAVIAPT